MKKRKGLCPLDPKDNKRRCYKHTRAIKVCRDCPSMQIVYTCCRHGAIDFTAPCERFEKVAPIFESLKKSLNRKESPVT